MAEKIIPALSFDVLTPLYDVLLELTGYGSKLKKKVLARAHLRDGQSLLDVGCGTGTLVLLARKRLPRSRIVGIDADEKILRIVQSKIRKSDACVELVTASAEQLPFPAETFDAVVSVLVFHHLPTIVKRRAIREVFRVLKHDGRFLLADFGIPRSTLFRFFVSLVKLLRLPEAKTMQDNLEGKIPLWLGEVGFRVTELPPMHQGVQFLLATKSHSPASSLLLS